MAFNASQIPFSIDEAIVTLEPLLFLTAAIALYAVFVFKFYKFLASKDIFDLNLNQYNTATFPFLEKFVMVVFYAIEFLLIFPVFIYFWMMVITVFMSLISNLDFGTIMLISMALVASTRITAFYNEELSKELAKMIPYTLLIIFLVYYKVFHLLDVWEVVKNVALNWKLASYYLMLTILLEIVLRIWTGIISLVKPKTVDQGES